MSVSTNSVTLTIHQEDANGATIHNRLVGPVQYAGVAGELDVRTLAADTSNHVFDLPSTNVLQFYFKNTHATAVITLIGTVQGGASQTLAKVQPGGVFVYWAASISATAGYTALSYTSDTASATAETFLGG
jgi:hypothetical protein